MKKLGFLWIGLVGCNIGNEPVYDQLPVMESALPEKRTAAVVPSRGVSHVNWPLALEAERLPRDVLVPEELDLPVLLLDAPVAMFISEEHWYTASYRFSDHNVVIEGTRIVFSDSVPEGTSTPLRDAPRVATTHHIVDASASSRRRRPACSSRSYSACSSLIATSS